MKTKNYNGFYFVIKSAEFFATAIFFQMNDFSKKNRTLHNIEIFLLLMLIVLNNGFVCLSKQQQKCMIRV